MKVIKQLKRDSPEDRLKRFMQEMSIVTKALLIVYSFIALIILIAPSMSRYSLWTLFTMRFGELVLFNLVAISDLKREEGKGSFFLVLSFLAKNTLLLCSLFLLSYAVEGWPEFGMLGNTAIIIQYLFMIMVEDALRDPEGIKYLFIEPFQVKAKFYPLFFFLILLLAAIRVDLLVPIVLGGLFHFTKCSNLLTTLSSYLDDKLLTENLVSVGFLKTGSEHRVLKTMDEMVTSDSVIMQQK